GIDVRGERRRRDRLLGVTRVDAVVDEIAAGDDEPEPERRGDRDDRRAARATDVLGALDVVHHRDRFALLEPVDVLLFLERDRRGRQLVGDARQLRRARSGRNRRGRGLRLHLHAAARRREVRGRRRGRTSDGQRRQRLAAEHLVGGRDRGG